MSNPQQPVAQLESLKYRATQIMESITALQFLIDANGQPVMPSWPDILARYNLLLSQIHSLSVSLSFALAHHQPAQQQLGIAAPPPQNPFQKLVLHPGVAIPEQQLDNALAPLLRNQPTVPVLKEEDVSVRRIAAVLKAGTPDGPEGYEQVVQECTEIKKAHDARVERAVKAAALLRDRYEWRARIDPEDVRKEEEEQGGDGDGDVTMAGPDADATAGGNNSPTPIGSTPGSQHSDEANEAREADDVLGQGTTPG